MLPILVLKKSLRTLEKTKAMLKTSIWNKSSSEIMVLYNHAWVYTVNLLVLTTSNCVQACCTFPSVLLPWQQYWPESLVCNEPSRSTWPLIRNVPFETARLPLGRSPAFHHVTSFAHKEHIISAADPSILVWCAVMISFRGSSLSVTTSHKSKQWRKEETDGKNVEGRRERVDERRNKDEEKW